MLDDYPVAIENIKKEFELIFESDLVKEIIEIGHIRKIQAGQVMMEIGQKIKSLPIVVSGTVRIYRDDKDGNELFLYYLNKNEVCAMSMTCCIKDKPSEIRAIAETDAEIWMVPLNMMEEWIKKYATWRAYVFDSYNHRFEELLEAINSIAFMKMDERLMKYLLDKQQNTGSFVINETHQEIAQALNTSRVVVSRLLKQLEREEKLELHRNRVEIL